MNAGDVFRIVNKADKHARVIISDPLHFPARVLFVGMTSWDPREDQSCILDVGDHSSVSHKTCIAFSRALVASDADLEKLVNMKALVLYEPVSEDVLHRIRAGAMRSTRIALAHKTLLIQQAVATQP